MKSIWANNGKIGSMGNKSSRSQRKVIIMNFIQIIKETPLTIMTILIISSLFMIPVSASTIADLELVSTKHDFGPGVGGIESKEQTIFLPETGWLTVTYQTDPYLGDMKGGPDFFPTDLGTYYLGQPGQMTYTPPKWVKGQPGKYVIKSYINTPQGDRPFIVKLVAPWQCQAFQICNAGTVYAAKQRLTYEYTPDSGTPSIGKEDYPDGTLLKGSGIYVYVIENGMRRLIPDEKTFNSMGYNWNAIKVISDSDLSSIPQGTDIA